MHSNDLLDRPLCAAVTPTASALSRLTPVAWRRCLPALAAAVLVACGGGNDGDVGPRGATGLNALLNSSIEPAGDRCLSGGVRIGSGRDANRDGVLQAGEVEHTQYICNGSDGIAAAGLNSLVEMSVLPAGAQCAAGGSRVQAGLDTNRNGVLDAAEVSSTAHVCGGQIGPVGATGDAGPNGASGLNSLMKLTPEPAGARCATGGQRVDMGLDANANGLLDSGEATRTDYVCRGSAGAQGPTGPEGPAGLGVTWNEVSASSTMLRNQGYIVRGADEVRLSLPTNAQVGDVFEVTGAGTGGWRVVTGDQQTILTQSLLADYFNPGQSFKEAGPSGSWLAMALSPDGSKAVGVFNGGRIYYSSDAGATWAATANSTSWYDVAMSRDGHRVVAGSYPYVGVSVSADSGATWTPTSANFAAISVAIDATGNILMATEYASGRIQRSTDFGVTWVQVESLTRPWGVAMSGDGNTIITGGQDTPIHRSVDGGTTWTRVGPTLEWRSMSMSADGSRMLAVATDGLHLSTDGGLTWTRPLAAVNLIKGRMSNDGMTMLASGAGSTTGAFYISSDGGATWGANTRTVGRWWHAIAISGDGKKAITGEADGPILVSTNERTTPVTGGLVGAQFDGVTLQYVGSGVFVPVSHSSRSGRFKVY